MPDLHLQALIQGQIKNRSSEITHAKKAKDKFEIETERQIEEYIKTLSFEEDDPSIIHVITPAMQRAKIKEELKEEVKLKELSSHIASAFKIITTEGHRYLDAAHIAALNDDFAQAENALDEMDLNSPPRENFQMAMHFTESTIESIFTIAIAKFDEAQYSSSLSLFILLSTLIPENADYWCRAGILALECQNYELAIRLFSATTALDPSLIVPWIFSADCYLKLNLPREAEAAYAEAIKISETSQIDPFLEETLSQLKSVLKQS